MSIKDLTVDEIVKLNKKIVGTVKLRKKDIIEDKDGLTIWLEHKKGTIQDSLIGCDRIEYWHRRRKFNGRDCFDHHLMFYWSYNLVFKVWLPNDAKKDKEFKDINEALKSVGIEVIRLIKG